MCTHKQTKRKKEKKKATYRRRVDGLFIPGYIVGRAVMLRLDFLVLC